MTAEELYACEVALKIRHNWSDKEFYNQMEVVATTFPEEEQFPASLYYAKKGLEELCMFAPTYVVYCREHLLIVDKSKEKIKEATCPMGESLTEKLEEGDLQFVTIAIKDQIESFVIEKNFQHTVRCFSKLKECHMRGKLHGDNVEKMHFDLTLLMDGSQLHKKTGNHSLPAYLVFNNVPLHYQLRYPLLGALFVGRKKHIPPRDIFLQDLVEELNELAKTPIKWVDDIGVERNSLVKVATFVTDAEEKSEVMGHVAHGGYFSCQFCEMKGEQLTKAKYEHLFRPFPLKKTKISTKKPHQIPGGPRYPVTIWENNFQIRDRKKRIETGQRVLSQQIQKGNPKLTIKGIRSTPAIYNLANFDETSSHVADTLHGICHGLFKDIITKMVTGFGETHNFARNANMDFTEVGRLQETLTRSSEVERNCYPISLYAKWNAYDEFQFILHSVALLCSDKLVFPNQKVYKVLIHLANVVYLAHYGRTTEDVIEKVEEELKIFCRKLKKTFGEEYCTHKFHVMQHIPHFMRMHGSALWTDGWNMERLNLFTRSLTNATNNELGNIVRNFLIKHHGSIFKNIGTFQNKVQKLLHKLGIDTTVFGFHFQDKVKKVHPSPLITSEAKTLAIQEAVTQNIGVQAYAEAHLVRITSMIRKGVILESNKATHMEGSKVRDSYIQVEGEHFGEIEEIFSLKEEDNPQVEKFIIVLRKFKRQNATYETGEVVRYPMNTFAYLRPHSLTGNLHVFVLNDHTFIQKAHVGEIKYANCHEVTMLFTVSPNEWYHF